MDRLISEQAVLEEAFEVDTKEYGRIEVVGVDAVMAIPSAEPKKCKDCKWWKDSDGAYRRGIGAESPCPINRIEVFEGDGYCYMFEPQESEVMGNANGNN